MHFCSHAIDSPDCMEQTLDIKVAYLHKKARESVSVTCPALKASGIASRSEQATSEAHADTNYTSHPLSTGNEKIFITQVKRGTEG